MKRKAVAVMATIGLFVPMPIDTTANAAAWKCGDWHDAAITAGWAEDEWPILDAIIWRESRCDKTAYNGRGRDKSYGLTQLNMRAHKSWVSPIVGGDFSALLEGDINLSVARVLFEKAEKVYGCGWKPWVTKKTRKWCR